MNGIERSCRRWKNLKRRLGLKGMVGCCGAVWGPRTQTITIVEEETRGQDHHRHVQQQVITNVEATASGMMNLAMALAAERNSRDGGNVGPAPAKDAGNVKSLMMLIEEADGVDWKNRKSDVGEGGGSDWMCCVCMERNKGAAFIPCGHSFCRVCTRELWVSRGSCPICNRSILEILDIF